jgi:FkbM family methyltransferase
MHIKFFAYIIISIFKKNRRFIRISKKHKGKIAIFDRHRKVFFSVLSRNTIDSITVDQIFKDHDYDLTFLRRYAELSERYQRIVATGNTPLIIDCGANIGLASLYFSMTFPAAEVLAVEPEAQNCDIARKNCSGASSIKLVNAAVGSEDGYVGIEDDSCDNNAFRTVRGVGHDDRIEMISINTLLSRNPNSVPFLIKIDIEGFEEDLFAADTGWIERFPILIIETHDWMLPGEANSNNFLREISLHDRDFIHRGENIFSIANS